MGRKLFFTVNQIGHLFRSITKKDILLVNCPPWGVDSPPLSIAYLESYLDRRGFKTDVIDFNIELYHSAKDKRYLWDMNNKNQWRDKKNFKRLLPFFQKQVNSIIRKISNHPAKLVGFSISDPKQEMSMKIIEEVKKLNPKKIVVAGGAYFSFKDISLFSNEEKENIDYFITGPGEQEVSELLTRIKLKKSLKTIPGVSYFENGKHIRNSSDYKPTEFREYAFPTYKNFKLKLYKAKSISVEWSRGCIGKCGFCQNTVYHKKYQLRTPENILEEIEYNIKRNQRNHLSVIDPSINGSIKNLEKVCDLIIQKDFKIKWSGLAIPRKEMTFRLLRKMKKAGCERLEYGVESGSNKVLKKMKKMHTIKEAEEVIKNTKKAGIKVVIFLIVGYPGENEKDFEKTLDFLDRNKANIDLIRSINTPYLQKGTDLMENADKYGIIIDKNQENYDYNWYTKNNKNTVGMREKREKNLISHIIKLEIPYEIHTLNENKKFKIE